MAGLACRGFDGTYRTIRLSGSQGSLAASPLLVRALQAAKPRLHPKGKIPGADVEINRRNPCAPGGLVLALAPLLLVILASLTHATWNLFAKKAAAAGPVFVCTYNIVSCAAYAPLVAFQLSRGHSAWSWTSIEFILLSGAIHLAYSVVLQRGYQEADLSIVYPVARGTGPMLSTIAAVVILGETPTAGAVAGLVLVVAGIALIATRGELSAFRRPGGHAGVRWGSGTGGLIAAYTVVDAYAVKAVGVAPVVLDWCSNLLRFVALAPVALFNPAATLDCYRRYWREALVVGLLSPLGYILILAALSSGAPLSKVAPMREMSMMVGTLLGMAFLGEKVGRLRLAGCAVLIAGVVLLSSS